MSLNLGNVNFGVSSQTQGLQKSMAALSRFEKQVNRIAKSQTQGATQTVNAMARQESAIRRAYQQTVQLRAGFSQLEKKATPQQLAALSNAFSTLTKKMTSGKLSTLEYTRAMDAFNAKMLQATSNLRGLKQAQDVAKKSAGGLTDMFRNLESASVLAVGPLSGLGARIRSLSAIMSRGTVVTALFFGAFAAGTLLIAKVAAESVRAGVEFEKAMARFEAASGSTAVAARDMLFVIKTSSQLGLRIQDNIKAFSRLTAAAQGTSLEGRGIQNVFKGISTAAAALKMDSLEVEGVMRAVEQMISKGTVQAEELRGQLGERLPGAFRLSAEAMGVYTEELNRLLKNGEVIAEDFLPKFANLLETTFSEAATKNATSYTGAMNRLANSWFLLTVQTDKVTRASAIVITVLNKVADVLDWVRNNTGILAKIFGVLTGVVAGLITKMAILSGARMVGGIIGLAKGFGLLTKSIAFFNIAANANPAMALAKGVLTLAAVVGGATAGYMAMKNVLKDVDDLMASLEEQAAGAGNLPDNTYEAPTVDDTKFRRQIAMMDAAWRTASDPALAREFEERTSKIIEFGWELQDAGIKGKQFNDLMQQFSFQTFIESGQKWRTEMNKLTQEFDVMDARIEAMQQGSLALDFFDKVTAPIDAYRNALIQAGMEQRDVIDLTAEYAQRIQEAYRLEKNMTDVAKQSAQAIGNTFETLIMQTESLKDSIKSLIVELIRLTIRAQVIDPLVQSLTGVFEGSGFKLPKLAGAKAGGGNVRAGGTYRVGEQGMELFTPKVNGSITPSHKMGGGGNTTYISIDARGADAGVEARLRQVVMQELAPQIVKAATHNTINTITRPRF